MVVVIVLVGIAIGAAVITLANSRRAKLQSTAGKMASMARYLYNRAIIDGRPYRLVIDLDPSACVASPGGEEPEIQSQCFWGEPMLVNDPCARYVPSPDAEQRQAERRRQEKKRELRARGGTKEDEDAAAAVDAVNDGAFGRVRSDALRPRRVPAQIKVSRVMTAHHDEPQSEGRVAIHFFPSGRAERALIWWAERSSDEDADEDGFLTVYTLEVEALTGRVKKHVEELTPEFLKKERSL